MTDARETPSEPTQARVVQNAVRDAREAGLLDGRRTRHISFRAPVALVEAAMRETGVTSPTELGVAALAVVAQRDPFVEWMKKNEGALGPDFDLDY